MRLNQSTLSQIDLPKPEYDRSKLQAGIVHIGLGNFHRAHQAWYLHRLMQSGRALGWAIVGAGVRPYDLAMREKIVSQDCLTTLIELDPSGRSAEVIGSMTDYVPIEEGNAALIRRMSEADIRIVSTTVTEGGYYIDPASKGFDAKHEDMVHDAAHPEVPRTAFGAIIAALKARRVAGLPAFTCQSCDNLQGNGDIMKQTVVSLARMSDPDLADWIEENASFPNSMVDCIVPATGPNELALARDFGVDDQVPVTHENFRQWVIEDNFVAGRPEWEQVGVTISQNVHDYELMKIRVLNGGHQVIAATGDLMGIATISGCMEDPLINALFFKVELDEIMPNVKAVPEFDPPHYIELINKRLSNPEIVDTTRRVAFDGSSRQPGFILPSVHDNLKAGRAVEGLALVSAIWSRYCLGTREDGSPIEPNDPYWDDLNARAANAKNDPISWLQNRVIYGDLADEPAFSEPFAHWLKAIYSKGLKGALQEYLG